MTNKLEKFSNFVIFKTPKGKVNIDVVFQDENLWLTQKKMGELFEVETNTINYHLKEIFKSKELEEEATIRKIRIVQKEGSREVSRELEFYNLDAILNILKPKFLQKPNVVFKEHS